MWLSGKTHTWASFGTWACAQVKSRHSQTSLANMNYKHASVGLLFQELLKVSAFTAMKLMFRLGNILKV